MAGPAYVSVTIDGKPACLTFDDHHFYLHRIGPSHHYQSFPTSTPPDPAFAALLIPLALVLHASFVPDADGGSYLVNVLSPPLTSRKSLGEAVGFQKHTTKAQSVLSSTSNGTLAPDSTAAPTPQVAEAERLQNLLDGPCSNLRLVKIEARAQSATSTSGHTSATSISDPADWASTLLSRAYPSERGIRPHRRLFILINPVGGPGKARAHFELRVRPILEAAGCTLQVHYTTHHLHGYALIKDTNTFKLDNVDAIVTVSGDGMVHEVLNALAARPDAKKALRIPIAPVPAGSGNASAINLLGAKNGFSLALASLNVIKGRPVGMDLCVVTQPYSGPNSDPYAKASLEPPVRPKRDARKSGPRPSRGGTTASRSGTVRSVQSVVANGDGHPADSSTDADAPVISNTLSSATASRFLPHSSVDADPASLSAAPHRPYVKYYAFLSAAIGLMADIDLGTEHMRALGDARFVIGYLQGVVTNKVCPVQVDLKLGENGTVDRREMRARLAKAKAVGGWSDAKEEQEETGAGAEEEEGDALGLDAPLRHGSVLDELYSSSEGGDRASLPSFDLHDPSWPQPSQPALEVRHSPNEWQRLSQNISTLYAGKMPYVSRDLMQFPFAYPGDGTIDVALLLDSAGRVGKIRTISSAENGGVVYDRDLGYAKVEAIRVTPCLPAGHRSLKGGGMISMDGEAVEYSAFQIEVVRETRWFALSLYGNFAAPIVYPPGAKSEAEAKAVVERKRSRSSNGSSAPAVSGSA
ncbi:sphinganine kinase lcb4 [Tilletia horrida]|uniref:Sphinganine kinase lcb4 n=1 Tax=Tilletia horrida TaxID=155126 RepID=A0AAN6JSF8_9BASI|nr:sphinganine kinase lcb4 [Tilletia horrida]KAK0553052.1 sphinganine kinase lcb4 [Tilletia horrida]KAK0569710.1 sphinganine kinase lcb4 [Tilletia horrida]